MAIDQCDQCRYSTPGGFYCGKGLKDRSLNVIEPREEIHDCSGYEQGKQARSIQIEIPIAPLSNELLYNPYLVWLEAWGASRRRSLLLDPSSISTPRDPPSFTEDQLST